MDRLLVLVRHGQSEWNLKNLFTGWKDPDLTEQGVREAHAAGQKLKAKGFRFDIAYTSALTRAQHTLRIMLGELGQPDLATVKDQALNERDYGDLTGLNKDEAREKWGDEQVHVWRRSYDIQPPGGESLRARGDDACARRCARACARLGRPSERATRRAAHRRGRRGRGHGRGRCAPRGRGTFSRPAPHTAAPGLSRRTYPQRRDRTQ